MKNIVSKSIVLMCCSVLLFFSSCNDENIDQQVTTSGGQGGSENFCEELTGANDNYPSGFIGAECWTTDDEQGTISEDCACIVGNIVFDCPDLQLNFEDDCQTGAGIGYVNPDCECVLNVVVFDCPDLDLNIGDGCGTTDAAVIDGVVTQDCDCELINNEFDCPGLGDVGDPCQGGWGTVTADCDCVENQPQGCTIQGKWLLTKAGGADLPPNTMYEFQDGIRYTYYCTDGESCDWAGMTIEDAIPGTNDYIFEDNSLTVDLNFGNISVNDVEFECECNVLNLQFTDSSWTWWRIGTNPDDCN